MIFSSPTLYKGCSLSGSKLSSIYVKMPTSTEVQFKSHFSGKHPLVAVVISCSYSWGQSSSLKELLCVWVIIHEQDLALTLNNTSLPDRVTLTYSILYLIWLQRKLAVVLSVHTWWQSVKRTMLWLHTHLIYKTYLPYCHELTPHQISCFSSGLFALLYLWLKCCRAKR